VHGAGGLVNLRLGHYVRDGIKVIEVQGEIDIYTAPRLRELLIELVSKNSYHLVVNLEKVGFLDSTGLGVPVGGLRRVRAHDGSLDPVCTQQRILKIFKITGLTEVFDIHETVDQAIAARGPPVRNLSPGRSSRGLGVSAGERSHPGTAGSPQKILSALTQGDCSGINRFSTGARLSSPSERVPRQARPAHGAATARSLPHNRTCRRPTANGSKRPRRGDGGQYPGPLEVGGVVPQTAPILS
jgi:anti-sigma B factor antagonist